MGGLYTQRKQGIDAQQTSKLAADALSDKYFMMRIRIDGRILTTEQVRAIAGISRDFARGTADITDRQNIQLHWVEIENVPEIWRRLDEVGLDSVEACGDTPPRGFLGSPVAGVAANEIIDTAPVADEIKRRFLGNPKYSNLPRKFKTAITGHPQPRCRARDQRHLPGRRPPPPTWAPGYDLWVGGGGLSTTPAAGRADRRLRLRGRRRRRLGRRHLDLPRLRLPQAAHQGPAQVPARRMGGVDKFRQVLEDEYLAASCPTVPPRPPDPSAGPYDHVGIHDQKDGRKYVGFAPTVGRVSGDVLFQVAEHAEAAGSKRVALTPHQKILVLDVDEAAVDSLVRELGGARPAGQSQPVPSRHDGLHRHRVLQVGLRGDQGAGRAYGR